MLDRLRRRSTRRALRALSLVATLPAAVHAAASWRGRAPMDTGWYAAQGYPRARGQVLHYLLVGRRAGWSPHPLLEPAWVAPASWRRRWPEPLAAPDPGSATHPALAPGALSVGGARALTADATVLTLLGGPVRYDRLRAAAVAAVGVRRDQEALRLLPRVREHWTSPPPTRGDVPTLPGVSVVMPVRDRPQQVVDAIESVRAQTHRDWHLVVVDDGSSDTTPDVVAAIAARDPRVELVRAEHGGVSAARNLGAARATGEVLAWLDSDNTWTPDHLRTMLTALAATGAESAYAVLEQHASDGVRYRALDAGRPALALRNHIDLNVLVARRHAVEAVGGFDTSLRRAVDYDLVLRLAERARPLFVPAVGARYDARRDAADRVTVRESSTWSDVVRSRRLVDWAALEAGLDARVADRLSVVLVVEPAVTAAAFVPTVLDAVRHAAGDVEVVVVDAGGSRATGTALAGLAASCERITVLRWPAPMTPGWALAHALDRTSGASLAVPDAGTRLAPGYDLQVRAGLSRDAAHLGQGVLGVRAADLVAVRGADALDPTPGWRAELVGRLTPGAGGANRHP